MSLASVARASTTGVDVADPVSIVRTWLGLAALIAVAAWVGSAAAQGGARCDAATVGELRACVEALRATGGTIAIAPGRYVLAQHVHIPYSGIQLEGAGAHATRFELADQACQAAFVIGTLALDASQVPALQHAAIRKLAIDGNKAGNPCCERYTQPELAHLYVNGISVFNAQHVELADVVIEDARSGGIVTDRGVRDLTIVRATIRGSAWDAVALYQTRASRVLASRFEHNAAAGISLDWYADANFFANNRLVANGRGETSLDVARCPAIDRARASPGVFVAGCSDNVFVHNTIAENGSNGVQLDFGSDERTGSTRNYFGANIVRDNAEFGVWVIGNATRDNLALATFNRGNRLGPLLLTGTTSPAEQHFLAAP